MRLGRLAVATAFVLALGSVALAGAFNDAANGDWDAGATWGGANYPGDTAAGDTATVDSHAVAVNVDLTDVTVFPGYVSGTTPAVASITVSNSGKLDFTTPFVADAVNPILPPVTVNSGGELRFHADPTASPAFTVNASGKVTGYKYDAPITVDLTIGGGTIAAQRWDANYKTVTFAGTITLTDDTTLVTYSDWTKPQMAISALVQDDNPANDWKLVYSSKKVVTISNPANSYGGGTEVNDGAIYVGGDGALGTGDVVINGGQVRPRVHQSAGNMPDVTVHPGGVLNMSYDIGTGCTITVAGGSFGGYTDPGRSWTCSADIDVTADSRFYPGGRTSWYSGTLKGDISGADVTISLDANTSNPNNQVLILDHADVSYEGDWIVVDCQLRANQVGALGTGDVILRGDAGLAELELDAAGATSEETALYLLAGGAALLDLDADNTVLACSVGGALVADEVVGGTWLPEGDYDSTTPDPPGVTLSDYFDFGSSTLTVLHEGLLRPVPEPAGLGLMGLALLGLRKKRS